MHNPAIRFASPGDIDAVTQIMAEAVRLLPSRDWYLDDDASALHRYIREDGYILVYDAEGDIAGFLLVRHPGLSEENLGRHMDLNEEELLHAAHMESAAVSQRFRGRGILRQLLEEAVLIEKEAGQTRHFFATVHPDNHFCKNNLEAVGFETLTTLKKYGDWVRDIVYRPMR